MGIGARTSPAIYVIQGGFAFQNFIDVQDNVFVTNYAQGIYMHKTLLDYLKENHYGARDVGIGILKNDKAKIIFLDSFCHSSA